MSALGLGVRQVRYENKAFWRNPAAAFFTFVFPLMFLFVFTTLLGNETITLPSGVEVKASTYYTASILAFSVITACYTNIAISVTFLRDEGILKRVRGTPLRPSSYLLGRVLHAMIVMAILVVIVCTFGALVYDITLPTTSAPALIVTLLVGAFAFCALGLAATVIVPNADASPAVVNATVFPLLFLSGVFIPIDDGPAWIRTFADIFPIRPFLEAVFASFLPARGDAGWHPADLAQVAAWGLFGLLVAAKWFRWERRR